MEGDGAAEAEGAAAVVDADGVRGAVEDAEGITVAEGAGVGFGVVVGVVTAFDAVDGGGAAVRVEGGSGRGGAADPRAGGGALARGKTADGGLAVGVALGSLGALIPLGSELGSTAGAGSEGCRSAITRPARNTTPATASAITIGRLDAGVITLATALAGFSVSGDGSAAAAFFGGEESSGVPDDSSFDSSLSPSFGGGIDAGGIDGGAIDPRAFPLTIDERTTGGGSSAKASSSTSTSDIVRYRSSGSFLRHRSTISSRPSGSPGRRSDSERGSVSTMFSNS